MTSSSDIQPSVLPATFNPRLFVAICQRPRTVYVSGLNYGYIKDYIELGLCYWPPSAVPRNSIRAFALTTRGETLIQLLSI